MGRTEALNTSCACTARPDAGCTALPPSAPRKKFQGPRGSLIASEMDPTMPSTYRGASFFGAYTVK